MRSIGLGTPASDWTSVGVFGNGEYGVPGGLSFSFPVTSDGSTWRVVEGLEHDAEAQDRLRRTTDELITERGLVSDYLR